MVRNFLELMAKILLRLPFLERYCGQFWQPWWNHLCHDFPVPVQHAGQALLGLWNNLHGTARSFITTTLCLIGVHHNSGHQRVVGRCPSPQTLNSVLMVALIVVLDSLTIMMRHLARLSLRYLSCTSCPSRCPAWNEFSI